MWSQLIILNKINNQIKYIIISYGRSVKKKSNTKVVLEVNVCLQKLFKLAVHKIIPTVTVKQ